MGFKQTVAPDSAEQILLVVLLWVGVTIVLARLFDSAWVRWEIVLSTFLLFSWAAWAAHYRLEQHQQERYKRSR